MLNTLGSTRFKLIFLWFIIKIPSIESQIPIANATLGNFVMQIMHQDPVNKIAYVTLTPANTTNMHEPRIELRYQSKHPYVDIDEKMPNNTLVAAVIVNDEDTGPSGDVTLSIEHGNELNHFKLVRTTLTNTIQVNGAPLSKYKNPVYNLTIVARDQGSPPKSSAVNLVIYIQNGSGVSAPLEPNLKPPVRDFMYIGLMLVVVFSALILVLIISCALVRRPKSKAAPPRTTSTRPDHCLYLGQTNF